MKISNLIGIIKNSIDIICECKGEKQIQDLLAAQLDCESRQTLSSLDYPNVEIDVLGKTFVIEIKLNSEYYSGISQLLAQKILYNYNNLYLLHVHKYLNEKFINGFMKLTKQLGINGILIDVREKQIYIEEN